MPQPSDPPQATYEPLARNHDGGALIDLTSGSTTIAIMGITLLVLSVAFSPVGSLRRASAMPVTRA